MTSLILSVLAIAAGSVYLRAEKLDMKAIAYCAKPLATLAILLVALFAIPSVSLEYQRLIVIGLVLSMLGDILLMLRGDYFKTGLVAFLAAHVAYILAFAGRVDTVTVVPFFPYALAVAFILRLLWGHLGAMKIPVLLYTIVIGVMAALSLAGAVDVGGSAWLAAGGAFLFTLSDATLAMDRFVGDIPGARAIIMWTYWPAQLLIALSV